MIKIYNMDAMKALKQMPDESVDMQITSPPYWGLRDYGVEGQLGLESTFDEYINKLCDIFDEVKRVLKKDGTCFVNLGDTYSAGGGAGSGEYRKKHTQFGKIVSSESQSLPRNVKGMQPKCLCAIPERFMIEMINRGWILRNKIIWHKPNHMPTSVKDRFANSWEYLFFFSKSKKYYFDLDAVREPHKTESVERACRGRGEENKSMKSGQYAISYAEKHKGYKDIQGKLDRGELRAVHPKGKNPGDVISAKFDNEEQLVKNVGISSMSARLRKDGENYTPNEKGKTPDDIIQIPYAVAERQKEIIEYRNLPDIKEFAKYINDKRKEIGLTIDQVEEHFGNQAPHHWFNAESFPSSLDYMKLKTLLELDDRYTKSMKDVFTKPAEKQNHPEGKNPSDFWDITTKGYPGAHFATFPRELVQRPIKTTRKNAVIMDIFTGSGTTLEVARDLHRDSIGIEIKPDYCKLIEKRLFKGNKPLINDFEIVK